jgi:glycosyltransferase involved in cell wall biosynthesis
MSAAPANVVVIPCYNEERRLRVEQVVELRDLTGGHVLLVDDGSTDGTAALLHTLAADHDGIDVLHLRPNRGKAEAVRQGLLAAVATGTPLVAFTDADFATPPREMARLVHRCADEQRPVVIGSRVDLMGHRIDRNEFRHYTGRIFATITSLVLGFDVYDTQCGAKAFATGTVLERALATPFVGRWSFDVELLGRLAVDGTDGFLEVPLDEWHEVGGSKLNVLDSLRTTAELFAVRRALRDYRNA